MVAAELHKLFLQRLQDRFNGINRCLMRAMRIAKLYGLLCGHGVCCFCIRNETLSSRCCVAVFVIPMPLLDSYLMYVYGLLG